MARVRIHNATGSELDRVLLYPPAAPRDPIDFGALASGGYSDYRDVPGIYRFAHIEASGPAGSHVLRPYDFVGEEPLAEGRYTYHLRIEGGRLALTLEGGTDEQDE